MLLLTAFACGLLGAEDAAMFRAGAAMLDITPPLGVSLAGHMDERRAEHIHDPLHVRCLALDDGKTRLALAMVDNCLIPREIFEAAKQRAEAATGLPAAQMLMAATHTHSGPTVTPIFQSEPEKEYAEFLTGRIADAVRCALNNLEPARIAWGRGSLPSEVHNRRWHMKPEGMTEEPLGGRKEPVRMNPPRASEHMLETAGPVDPEVFVLALQSAAGRPIALLANYSLHYVGGVPNEMVSADYFGVFARQITERVAKNNPATPPFVAMLSNGTSGDVNNIRHQEKGQSQPPFEQMEKVGGLLAEEAGRIHAGLEWRDGAPLAAVTRELELGLRRPTAEEVEDARAIMAAAKGPVMRTMPEIYAHETVRLVECPARVPLTIQALRIGDLAITAIPCEVFAETGLQLKAQSPFQDTFTIELANGYNGYLPPAAQHALGGYETWRARSSCLETGAEAIIAGAALELLKQLRP